MPDKLKSDPFKKKVTTFIILAIIIAILIFITDHPYWIERYYTNGLYRAICYILHPVFNLFPFSVGDIIYLLVVIYLIYAAIKLVKLLAGRRWRSAATFSIGLLIGLQVFILYFYLFWGMNYFRPSAAKRLQLADSGYTTADLRSVTSILIDSANKCRAALTTDDLQQNDQVIYQTAKNAVTALSGNSRDFHTYQPGIKPSLLSGLLNYLSTAGYYNPFTTEAQINYQMPGFLKPFVACHEMSHQMGFAPEDEANFAGFIAGIHSQDRLLRYSAYYVGAQEFMSALRRQDSVSRNELKKRISLPVLRDFKTERIYWFSFHGKLGVLSSFLYDDFLKVNNQPQGLNTYNQMVKLVMGWYKKTSVSTKPHNH